MRKAFTRMHSGFTLMELLVVIAILVILAAILFPSLRTAKRSAQKAVCVSHLRQAGLAARMYRDDWDGRYPLGAVPMSGGSWATSWHDLLMPPLSPGMLACPVAVNPGLRTSYGINRQVSGFGTAAGEWDVDTGWYITEKRNPDWPAFLPEERWSSPFWQPLDPRHGGKVFALYLDGSVRLQRGEDVR